MENYNRNSISELTASISQLVKIVAECVPCNDSTWSELLIYLGYSLDAIKRGKRADPVDYLEKMTYDGIKTGKITYRKLATTFKRLGMINALGVLETSNLGELIEAYHKIIHRPFKAVRMTPAKPKSPLRTVPMEISETTNENPKKVVEDMLKKHIKMLMIETTGDIIMEIESMAATLETDDGNKVREWLEMACKKTMGEVFKSVHEFSTVVKHCHAQLKSKCKDDKKRIEEEFERLSKQARNEAQTKRKELEVAIHNVVSAKILTPSDKDALEKFIKTPTRENMTAILDIVDNSSRVRRLLNEYIDVSN